MGIFSKSPDDSPGSNGKPLPGGEAGAVAAASAEVRAKHGGARPGAGRKPAGAPRAGVAQAPGGKEEQNQAPPSEADIEFVKTIAEAGLKILDRVETNIILGTINSIGDKYISERSEAYLKQREIGPGDVEVVVNAAGALAAKYSFLSRYAPEGALLSWAAIHGLAFQGVLTELRKLAQVVKEAKGKGASEQNANRPPAN